MANEINEIWETKLQEKAIPVLLSAGGPAKYGMAGVSRRFRNGRLVSESFHIKIWGGPEIELPVECWADVRGIIESFLYEANHAAHNL